MTSTTLKVDSQLDEDWTFEEHVLDNHCLAVAYRKSETNTVRYVYKLFVLMLNDLFFLRNMVSFDTFSFRVFYKHLVNNEKESLNNDGQQFHQYQQNEQPSQTIQHNNKNGLSVFETTRFNCKQKPLH